MDGCKAKRTGRVDTETGPAKFKIVVQPPGNECAISTGDKVEVDILCTVCLAPVVTCDTNEYPDVASHGRRSGIGDKASHFDGFICTHQRKPLCRVHLRSFPWRYAEARAVKEARIVEPATPWHCAGILALYCRVNMCLHIPATRRSRSKCQPRDEADPRIRGRSLALGIDPKTQ